MKNDLLRQFTSLRGALQREKTEIESRLLKINEVLGTAATAAPEDEPKLIPTILPARKPRGKNAMSLKEAVIRVTSEKALDRREIVQAVQNLGYRFTTKDPLNSLGNILYGKKPKFKNVGGKFSPAGPTAKTTVKPEMTAAKPKRKLSPEGRARIVAATKAYWERIRAEKGK